MDVGSGFIADPLIAPSGKVYSAGALKDLLRAIFQEQVDNDRHKYRGYLCKGGQYDEKRKPESGGK